MHFTGQQYNEIIGITSSAVIGSFWHFVLGHVQAWAVRRSLLFLLPETVNAINPEHISRIMLVEILRIRNFSWVYRHGDLVRTRVSASSWMWATVMLRWHTCGLTASSTDGTEGAASPASPASRKPARCLGTESTYRVEESIREIAMPNAK